MTAVICLDFGTSSLRAAYRDARGERKVLPIGMCTGSKSIDDASIRSEIHIDSKAMNVRFGEQAFVARSKLSPTPYYEASSKLWLREAKKLDHPAFVGLNVTREDLIIGLLAYALFAVQQSFDYLKIKTKLISCDIRIAHPVWSVVEEAAANSALLRMGSVACSMAERGDCGNIPLKTLLACTKSTVKDLRKPLMDVVEPVAAAIELLPSDSDIRKICAVIDIGAGTTDIGIFQSQSPFDRSSINRKLIPLSPTRSIFKAGDTIDNAVISMLSSLSNIDDNRKLYDIKSRIRQIKESLFTDGFVQELGVRLELEQLVKEKSMRAMALEIRRGLEQAIIDGQETVLGWTKSGSNSQSTIDVVMAGGGSNIKFIIKAIEADMYLNGKLVSIKVKSAEPNSYFNQYGASLSRLAVATGGVNDEYDSLQHEYTIPTSFPSLGFPKQVTTNYVDQVKTISVESKLESTSSSKNAAIALDREQQRASLAADRRKNWEIRLTALLAAAKAGAVADQYELALFLIEDDRVGNLTKALDWLHKGAVQGHAQSQEMLAELLISRNKPLIDLKNALFWIAVLGKSKSQYFASKVAFIKGHLNQRDFDSVLLEAADWKSNFLTSAAITPPRSQVLSDGSSRLAPVAANSPQVGKLASVKHLSRGNELPVKDGSINTDIIRIAELIKHARKLRPPLLKIQSKDALMKWCQLKNPFDAYFVAFYMQVSAPNPDFNDPTLIAKLDRWLKLSKTAKILG